MQGQARRAIGVAVVAVVAVRAKGASAGRGGMEGGW